MRPHYLPILTALLTALLYLTPLSFTLPNTPQLLQRSQFCVNDPLTVAGM